VGKGIVLAAFMALGLAGCATQMPDVGSASGRMPDFTVAAAAPAGFISFCLRFADQCERKSGAASSVPLTADTWRMLTEVNLSVNESICRRTMWPTTAVAITGQSRPTLRRLRRLCRDQAQGAFGGRVACAGAEACGRRYAA